MPHVHHSDTELRARIDADNDDLLRYVVRRYAYDRQRRERRHQVVAAFDNEREWGAFLDHAAAQLGQDRAAGLVTDPRDHHTGLVLEPGYQRRAQNGRLAPIFAAGSYPWLTERRSWPGWLPGVCMQVFRAVPLRRAASFWGR
jgi:hypothetical protein